MQPNLSEKIAINFVWVINYAKWGEKTLKKIIQNYKNEKQGLKSEKLDITDIIPNHGENYDNWHLNVFYVQNIISWGMKFPENPIRIFTAFADSASLISFMNEIRKFYDFHKYSKKINKLEKINNFLHIPFEKQFINIFYIFINIFYIFSLISILLISFSKKLNFSKTILNFSKTILKILILTFLISVILLLITFSKDYIYKNIEDIRDEITKLELSNSIKNTQEYQNYLENKEFYDDFVKQVDNLIPEKDFQKNMINNNTFNHTKIENLLIEFIQKKYKTDISLNKIKEEYQKTFKSFQEEFKAHNPNFEIIDFREKIKNDKQAKQDLSGQNNDDLKAQAKALNLLLKEEIFEMINFVDSIKIFINYYGFGYEKNLTIDMDITPLVFHDRDDINNIIYNQKTKFLVLERAPNNKTLKTEEKNLKDNVLYFGSSSPKTSAENQVCYTGSLHLQNLQKIFFFCITHSYDQDKIYRAIQNLFNLNSNQEEIIDNLDCSSRMYNSFGISGISDDSKTSMNQKFSTIERTYEFKINWIQDGLKFDINNPDLDIKLDDVEFIQETMGFEFKRKQ